MPNKALPQQYTKGYAYCIYGAIIAVTALFAVVVARLELARVHDLEVHRAKDVSIDISARLSEKLRRKLLLARVLTGGIALDPDQSQQDFARFASRLVQDEPAIVDIAAVRDFTITHVYPEEKNRAFIGFDLRARPDQAKVIETVNQTGEMALQGPINLLQGFPGYIVRQPVFIGQDGKSDYWGVVSVVFAETTFLEELQLDRYAGQYDIAIQVVEENNPVRTIHGSPDLFRQNVVTGSIDVNASTWSIAIRPVGGWTQFAPGMGLKILVDILLGLVALGVARYLLRLRAEAWHNAARLSAAIDALPDGFVLFDKDDRLIVFNEQYRRLYSESHRAIKRGAKFEDIIRFGLRHQQYPEAVGREEEWLAERMAAHQASSSLFEQKLKDGRSLRVIEKETPDGGRVGVRVDITDQVQSRERAELAERRLTDAIGSLPIGFWLFDSCERLISFNDMSEELTPASTQKLQSGMSLQQVVENRFLGEPNMQPDDTSSDAALLALLRQDAAEFETGVAGDRWFSCASRRTSEGGIVMFRVEVTEARRHEKRLESSNSELRFVLAEKEAAEKRFEDVADIGTEWFWEQDAGMRIQYVSASFERAMGLSLTRVLGRTRAEVMQQEDGSDDGYRKLKEIMDQRQPFEDFIFEASGLKGESCWLRTSGKPVFDKAGNYKGYRGTTADVTPLYSALREARKADAAKTQFLSVISHELRTPLTSVLGFNAFLAKARMLPSFKRLKNATDAQAFDDVPPLLEAFADEVSNIAGKMDKAGDQLKTLINDMLDLARIEANTIRIEKREVPIRAVIDSVAEHMRPLTDEKALELHVDAEDDIAYCDESRLRQILTNIVGNAIKFTERGAITVRSRRVDDAIRVEIEDTGIGMPQDLIPVVFDRFIQADNSNTRSHNGLGLGLAICKELVQRHGGWIKVESTEGVGSRFVFTLPAAQAEADAASDRPREASVG